MNSNNHKVRVLFVCALLNICILSAFAADPLEVNGLAFEEGKNKFDVIIKGKGSLQYSASFTDNPPRIDLSFVNTLNRIDWILQPKENPFVDQVGIVAQYTEKTLKMTVKLKSKFQYAVEGMDNGIILHLYTKNAFEPEPEAPMIEQPLPDSESANPPPAEENTASTSKETTTPAPAPVPASTQTTTTTSNPTPSSTTPAPVEITPAPAKSTTLPTPKPAPQVPPNDPATEGLVIGPDDLVEINVFQLPEFSVTTRVLGDGTITMPLIGTIQLSGLSRKDAEEKISQALTAKHVNHPSVSVTIKEYKSRQVSVLGAVKNPGIYFLASDRSLLQILSEAGGLAGDAGTTCYIFRGGSKIVVDLYDLMQNGNQQLNLAIGPGDVVNVPSQLKSFVYVLGAVKNPGAVEILPSVGLTLAAAIARAGGPSRVANVSNIQIKRKEQGGGERVIKANLKEILNNKVADVPLMSDDLINVPESFF